MASYCIPSMDLEILRSQTFPVESAVTWGVAIARCRYTSEGLLAEDLFLADVQKLVEEYEDDSRKSK